MGKLTFIETLHNLFDNLWKCQHSLTFYNSLQKFNNLYSLNVLCQYKQSTTGTLRDKIIRYNTMVYISNDYGQECPFCRLKPIKRNCTLSMDILYVFTEFLRVYLLKKFLWWDIPIRYSFIVPLSGYWFKLSIRHRRLEK